MSGLIGSTSQRLQNLSYVWDTNSLSWVAMQQPIVKTDSLSITVAAQPGVDIGDVTINNSSGAGAVNIQDGGNTITVDGTVTANISGSISNTSFAATQGTASNLKTESHIYDSSTNGITSTSNALDVNIKSGSIANTSFTISNASGGSAVNIQDGGNTITVDGSVGVSSMPAITGSVTAAVSGTVAIDQGTPGTTNAVVIKDSNGNILTMVKDQTNYSASNYGLMLLGVDDGTPQKLRYIRVEGVDNDGETPLTSGAISSESYGMVYNGSTWDRLRGTTTDGVLVNLGTNNDVTVTASSLPLPTNAAQETGGNLDDIAEAVECMDDFNETFMADTLIQILAELKVMNTILQAGLVGNLGEVKQLDIDKMRNEVLNDKNGGFQC